MTGKKQTTSISNKIKIKCVLCGRELGLREFYSSTKAEHKALNNKSPYCKSCVQEMIFDSNGQVDREGFIKLLSLIDRPMIPQIYKEVVLNSTPTTIVSNYISRLNLTKSYKDLTYVDTERFSEVLSVQKQDNHIIQEVIIKESDLKAKNDCIRLLGYDPFMTEQEKDKPKLYNTLIDYLDESTLEDSFKIPTVVQIVKSFNQIDKIDSAVSSYMSNPENIITSSSNIKALFDTKKSMLASILNMAKDNGISVNHSNNKSKGSGTLSGLIKKLGELDLDEAQVNLFDIETAEGMKQVADISNTSILQQLSFDENDYTDMIKEQRILIESLQIKLEKLEEENRKIKVILNNNKESGDN